MTGLAGLSAHLMRAPNQADLPRCGHPASQPPAQHLLICSPPMRLASGQTPNPTRTVSADLFAPDTGRKRPDTGLPVIFRSLLVTPYRSNRNVTIKRYLYPQVRELANSSSNRGYQDQPLVYVSSSRLHDRFDGD